MIESGYDIKVREIDLEVLFTAVVNRSALIDNKLVDKFRGRLILKVRNRNGPSEPWLDRVKRIFLRD